MIRWKNVRRSERTRRYIERRARNSIVIDRDYGLYLSEYQCGDAERFARCFCRTWGSVPADVRYRLDEHWIRLRSDWANRWPRLTLRLPIIGAFPDPVQVAQEIGFLTGSLLRAQAWNSYPDEGGLDIEQHFASSHLAFFDMFNEFERIPDEHLPALIAWTIANYDLCVSSDADIVDYMTFGSAEGSDEVAISWGFDINSYLDWTRPR